MTLLFCVAALAVALSLIGIAVTNWIDTNDRINRDIESLVMSKQMTDDLNAAANDLGWK
jgi:hypothetical protein